MSWTQSVLENVGITTASDNVDEGGNSQLGLDVTVAGRIERAFISLFPDGFCCETRPHCLSTANAYEQQVSPKLHPKRCF